MFAQTNQDSRYILAALKAKREVVTLTDEHRYELDALEAYARVYLESDSAKRIELLHCAENNARKTPHLSDFLAQIQQMLSQEEAKIKVLALLPQISSTQAALQMPLC